MFLKISQNSQENTYASVSFLIKLQASGPMSFFYTPWKCLKIIGFLMFSGSIEMEHWAKIPDK